MFQTLISWSKVDPGLGTKFMTEFIGCMLFHFIGSLCPTAVGNAVALMTLVYFTAKMSGGHLNPAVSLTFTLLGHSNPLEFIVYVASQVSGCIFGALWLALLVPGVYINQKGVRQEFDGCFEPDPYLTNIQMMGMEATGTFIFLLPLFSVVWYTQHKSGYGTTGPIMVGLSLLSAAMAVGNFTGASLNPARSLASFVVFQCVPRKTMLSYIVGEVLGAIVATITIIPWYGISNKSWYNNIIPKRVLLFMQSYHPSITIQTNTPEV
jgi:glycerol uptake facilitator-like aquaporin